MRPAQRLVSEMANYPADVTLVANDKLINGKSILSVMAAGIECGTKITVTCSGEKEQEMLAAAMMILGGEGE